MFRFIATPSACVQELLKKAHEEEALMKLTHIPHSSARTVSLSAELGGFP
jgi:hypothetical protein